MKLLRVLFINSGTSQNNLLRTKLSNNNGIKLVITDATLKNVETIYQESKNHLDVVLFGDKIPSTIIVNLTKMFRGFDAIIPIFIFSKQSEAQVPRHLKKAGVDDIINIAEIETPLFSWIFMSAVEHSILKKKAREYDVLHKRLMYTNESLANLVHDINNPLSVIRLTMYHLEDPSLPAEKKGIFFKLLISSLEKMDQHMKELRAIRRQLNGERTSTAKILSINPALNLSASK